MIVKLIISFLVTASVIRGDNVELLSSASSGFSQRLYQKLAVGGGDSIYSPYSIHAALSMTSEGARGETATQMAETLGLTSLGSLAHQTYHDVITQLNSATDVKLNTANALFVNPKMPIETQFVTDVQRDYFATSHNFDLAAVGGPEKAINDFVENKTEGLIKNILPPGNIDATTVMILVNTIFFNGTWYKQFDHYKTKQQDFLKLGGAKSKVDMMNDERDVRIRRNVNGADVAELPFKGNRFSLYIALPQKADGITDLESSLTNPGVVDQFFEGLTEVSARLSIPKFKVESTYQLSSALQQLGMMRPFNPATANFQGISRTGNLYISDVIHKALIEVKETGTVAAAATVIGIKAMASVEEPAPLEIFRADHPFVFFLRDNQSKQILFQGRFLG